MRISAATARKLGIPYAKPKANPNKRKKGKGSSPLEAAFRFAWVIKGLPGESMVEEFRFDPSRRWRADFCFPRFLLLVEIEGGVYSRGRHVRGAGYEADLEKYNRATELGFRILRFTKKHIYDGTAVATVRRMIEALR